MRLPKFKANDGDGWRAKQTSTTKKYTLYYDKHIFQWEIKGYLMDPLSATQFQNC